MSLSVRAALRYLDRRSDQHDYFQATTHALTVGSGPIERGHRQVLQIRLNNAGA